MGRTCVMLAMIALTLSWSCSPLEPMPDKTADGVPPGNAARAQADQTPSDQTPSDQTPSDQTPSDQTPSDSTRTDDGASDPSITDRMAAEHAGDSPTATAAATAEPADDVVTRRVEYANFGEPITGYLARPDGDQSALPAILMVHEWWGLNDNIEAMARRFAGLGYVVLAVDLYGGQVAQTAKKARRLMAAAMKRKKRALVNLSAARQYLQKQFHPPKTGIIGWCFGGGWALRGALNMKQRIDAVVMYYGEVITDTSQLADLKAPLLGLFASEDNAVDPHDVRRFDTVLDTLDKDATIKIFDGAHHAFANPSGQRYDKQAADKAWQMTTAFFQTHLNP